MIPKIVKLKAPNKLSSEKRKRKAKLGKLFFFILQNVYLHYRYIKIGKYTFAKKKVNIAYFLQMHVASVAA